MILAKGLRVGDSIFDTDRKKGEKRKIGGMVYFDVPDDCGLIVLAGNNGGGHQPFCSLLPHQVYMDNLRDVFKEKDFELISVLPVRSQEVFNLVYRDQYSKQRWCK